MSLPTTLTKYEFSKVELHCHLDGTYHLSSIVEMAKSRGVKLPSFDPVMLSKMYCNLKRCESLDDYLRIFMVVGPVFLGHPANIQRLARESVMIKASYGVRYIEMRYSPHLMLEEDSASKGIGCREIIQAVNIGFKEGMEEVKKQGKSIEVRSILCCVIFKPEWSMEVAELCLEFRNEGVVGIDVACAGDEEGDMILNHKKAFDFCLKHGIGRTAHAGEKGSSNEVKNAVEKLHVQRIGHGYHVLDDEELYKKCIEDQIHFEVCPLSSYLTGSVSTDMTVHPAIRFQADGLKFSLNTDDPGVQQSSIIDDYEIATKSFGFSRPMLYKSNIHAMEAAFVDKVTKDAFLEELKNEYQNIRPKKQNENCTFL